LIKRTIHRGVITKKGEGEVKGESGELRMGNKWDVELTARGINSRYVSVKTKN